MRRSRFANSVKIVERDPRAAWLETLSFDLRALTSDEDAVIAEQRVAQLTYVPLLLGVAHLISSVAILLHYGIHLPSTVVPYLFVPAALAMMFDLAALAFMRERERFDLSPRKVTLVMSLVVFVSCGLWSLFGNAAASLPDS